MSEISAPPDESELDQNLPENAFRELREGEVYRPVVPDEAQVREVTLRSVVQGFIWSFLFSAACTYIALKLGQGIESAIPISILAVGVSTLMVKVLKTRASSLLENVNVLAIGATSGIVAGGSVFTMPAIHILNLQDRSSFFQIFIVPLLGAILGIFFLAPFRRYFVRDLHGKLPFPEARATTEILVAGKKGGHSAAVLSYAALLAAAFDFLGPAMRAWSDMFSTASIGLMNGFTQKYKAVFTMNTSAAVMGLGFIMGRPSSWRARWSRSWSWFPSSPGWVSTSPPPFHRAPNPWWPWRPRTSSRCTSVRSASEASSRRGCSRLPRCRR